MLNWNKNGHITRTYTDKSGLEVMSKEGKGSDMLRTRRVYDGYGRLRTILYSGELRSMKAYNKTQVTQTRDYCGDFIFVDNALSMVNFPGGYFDSDGKPNYRHTDWQGNVTIVTNSEGKIAQHTGYYPYGEPWSEPTGQPYLYGGKERLREGALNEYDFGARRYNSALALWTTPDPMARDYSPYCPYIHCGSNPIRFKELDGCDWVERTVDGINEFYYDRTVSCAADVDRIYGSKSGVSYVSDGQSVNLGGNTFTFHNELGTVDKDGIGQDNSEIIYGEDYTIFGTTDNSCNAATLHKNLMGTSYTGPVNPQNYSEKDSYQYIPRNRSELGSMEHDKAYEAAGAAGVVGAVFDCRPEVIKADWDLVKFNVSNVSKTTSTKDKARSIATAVCITYLVARKLQMTPLYQLYKMGENAIKESGRCMDKI